MAINKAQCENGHFFNADRFDECPVCKAGIASAGDNAAQGKPKSGQMQNAGNERTQLESDYEDINKTEYISDEELSDDEPEPEPDSHANEDEPAAETETEPEPDVQEKENSGSGEEIKTVFIRSDTATAEPVTGWLVCIGGAHFGESFTLKAGNNYAGRGLDMDISLSKDNGVSRSRHCLIIFEPKQQDFYIQPGEGSGITYLNDEIVLTPAKLKANDRISAGGTELLFVPLCGGSFRWDDYPVKKNG